MPDLHTLVYRARVTTYLLKTEPDDYSYDDLVRDKKTVWDGVANPTACMIMRGVKKGDEAFIYHTGKDKCVAGLCRVTSDPYPDPKRPDTTAKGDTKFPVFDIAPKKKAATPVTLAAIKADERFADLPLVTMGRLSAMEIPPALDKALRSMAGI